MTTLINQEPRTRVPHHPASFAEPAPLPLWRRVIRRILSFFTP